MNYANGFDASLLVLQSNRVLGCHKTIHRLGILSMYISPNEACPAAILLLTASSLIDRAMVVAIFARARGTIRSPFSI